MSKSSMYKEIFREYERDRNRSDGVLHNRRTEIYKKCGRIEEIDVLLAEIGISVTKAIMAKKDDTEKLINELQKKSVQLLEEKDVLLVENGYPKDYLFSVHKCEHCKDTGYINNKKCKCFNQRLINYAYDMSKLSDVTNYENFDMFDFRYYSDKVDDKEKQSPKQKMQKIYSMCLKFVNSFDDEFSNLLFYGSSGLGKTFLCHSIAKELLDRGKTVIYVTAFGLFKMIEQSRFDKDEFAEPDNDFLDMVLTADLLIIDDLGTEFSTILSTSELFNILNSRLIERKHTVLSTNLSPSDLINQYSDRIVSRIYGEYKVLHFFGEDIRILKNRKAYG